MFILLCHDPPSVEDTPDVEASLRGAGKES